MRAPAIVADLPTVPWPPADTLRNRQRFGAGLVLAALATVYFALWALQSGALLIWTFFTLSLATALVLGACLLAMRLVPAAERNGTSEDSTEPPADPTADPTAD